jgi:hypothetical protein
MSVFIPIFSFFSFTFSNSAFSSVLVNIFCHLACLGCFSTQAIILLDLKVKIKKLIKDDVAPFCNISIIELKVEY